MSASAHGNAEFIKSHPSLISARFTITDSNGENTVYQSPMLGDNKSREDETFIDRISSMVQSMGMFSCRKIGVDQYDGKYYDDYCNEFGETIIEGAEIYINPPHHTVSFHAANMWIHHCFNIAFRVDKNIIPSETNLGYSSHNITQMIRFKRSSGQLCRGKINERTGIKIHRSKTHNDATPQFYCRVNFNINDSTDSLDWHKDVNLLHILEHNPEIRSVKFKFVMPTIEKYSRADKSVIDYYTSLHNGWVREILTPVIEDNQSKTSVTISHETC
tara:strand:- start:2240 stop:3061 length:822 start_codon:yes stop_codon:yes gene_type:complete